MKPVRYISMFSGVEACSLAWEPLGWEPVAFADPDPFASAVLAHRWPEVPNLGDITKVNWRKYRGTADVVVGGSPCQSFSIAGLRKGLDDPRGNLALEYLRAVAAIRPSWVIWENVTGALSVDRGRFFGAFLRALDELGYQCAWRVLDASFFGVPQRRRRVILVGHLGDWRGPAAVLLESEGLFGNPTAQRKAQQEAAALRRASLPQDGGIPDAAKPLAGHHPRIDLDNETYVATVRFREGCEGGGKGPLVTEDFSGTLATRNDQVLAARMRGFGDYQEDDCASALKARDYKDATDLIADPITASEGRTYTHEGSHNFRLHNVVSVAENQRAEVVTSDVTQSLSAGGGKAGQGYPAISGKGVLRRLTPLECERLQGFPDGHTMIPWKNGMAPDSLRYKAIGNSMAVPVMRYVGERIALYEEVTA